MNNNEITHRDYTDLKTAHKILENPGLAVKLINALGAPIERGLKMLPARLNSSIQKSATKAIEKSLKIAVSTMDKDYRGSPSNTLHKVFTGMSGALGGFFGIASLALELPVSTIIMLRSIADIARSNGEDFGALETRLACIEVFAMGGKSMKDDASETGYYATRGALAGAVSEATKHIAEKGLSQKSAPPLVRFIAQISSRFGISVSEKAAVEIIPVIGAIGGASVNLIFTSHFQDMASGHFTIRRLERKYGADYIKKQYDMLRI